MRHTARTIVAILFCLLISCCLTSCNKEKQGSLEITEEEFSLEQDSEKTSISLNVKGKVKNTSPYDIKNIVITGRSKSCSEVMVSGEWFVTQQVKREAQKDKISYLSAGDEASYSFKGIAYFFKSDQVQQPESYPEDLEVYVESFETVQD